MSRMIALLMLMLSASAIAQDANENELGQFFGSYPQTGAWFARDGSNTGFFFDIQNGILAGVYFGFDDAGNNVWLLFNGSLQTPASPESGIDWVLQTPLTRSANGGCIVDCNGGETPPRTTETVGDIQINFSGRSSGSFSIDGGDATAIVPLYFGTPAIISEVPEGIFAQPDIQGSWVVARGAQEFDDNGDPVSLQFAESASIIEIGEQEVLTSMIGQIPLAQGVEMVVRAPIVNDAAGLFPSNSFVNCIYFQPVSDPQQRESIDCQIVSTDEAIIPELMITRDISIELMSDSRFVVIITTTETPDNGGALADNEIIRLEGFRVGYD